MLSEKKSSTNPFCQLFSNPFTSYEAPASFSSTEAEMGKNLSGEQKFLCKNKDKWNFAEN